MTKRDEEEQSLKHHEGLEIMKRYLAGLKSVVPSPAEIEKLHLASEEVGDYLKLLAPENDESAEAYTDFLEAIVNHARSSLMLCHAWEGENRNAARLSTLLNPEETN